MPGALSATPAIVTMLWRVPIGDVTHAVPTLFGVTQVTITALSLVAQIRRYPWRTALKRAQSLTRKGLIASARWDLCQTLHRGRNKRQDFCHGRQRKLRGGCHFAGLQAHWHCRRRQITDARSTARRGTNVLPFGSRHSQPVKLPAPKDGAASAGAMDGGGRGSAT
jgi:hypothetical protein